MVSGALGRPGGAQVSSIRKELASLMHANAGMSRNDEGLNSTLNRIQAMKETYSGLGAGSQTKDYNFGLVQYLEVGSLLDVAETIVASALERKESRGVHVRTDYPQQDNAEPVRLQVTRAENGPVVTKQPVAQA
jgi:succinate dehydrogenase/fumarate reductase flavoprotein subunit